MDASRREPYIGDYDDPNLEDFNRKNVHLRTGYRIFFHSYDLCARSLLMVHNETCNVWSHFVGMLGFIAIFVYILGFWPPTSLHGSELSLVERWTAADFDSGRLDDSPLCTGAGWNELDSNGLQCPYAVEHVLDDLLETEKLLDWHRREGAREQPSLFHANLNYHAKAFEQADHYIRNTIRVLSQPDLFLSGK